MGLKQRVYSVLIVSAAEAFNNALYDMLPEPGYFPTRTLASIGAAKRALLEREYDYVLVNSPLPDGSGVRFAIDASHCKDTVVLLLIRAEFHDEIRDKVVEHGVFTLPKPTSRPLLATALNWMASARERLRAIETQTLSIEEKMAEIRIVNRAKLLLISQLHMDESQAHRYIEKQAMDRCITKKAVAEQIIMLYSGPAAPA